MPLKATGPSNAQHAVSTILWKDSELERIAIDYATLAITVKETTGLLKEIRCRGYIGYRLTGFWDEVVIDTALVFPDHPMIDECLEAIRTRYQSRIPESGSAERTAGEYFVLEITLDDGAELSIAAGSLEVRSVSG